MAESRLAPLNRRRARLALAIAVCAAHLACRDAGARVSDLQVDQARASVFPNGGGAAYLTIINRGSGSDRLESADADWAARVTLHEVIREGDLVSMRELPDGLPIPAGSRIVLQPGGRHLMLEGVSLGANVRAAPLLLHFARAGQIRAQLSVESSHF
jgi:copper(I)-binding protein